MSGLQLRDDTGKEITLDPYCDGFVLKLPHKHGYARAYLSKKDARKFLDYLQEQLK